MASKKKSKSKSKSLGYDKISGQLRVKKHSDDDVLMNHFVGKKYDNILHGGKTPPKGSHPMSARKLKRKLEK